MTSDEKFDKVLYAVMDLIDRNIIRNGEDIEIYINNTDRSSVRCSRWFMEFDSRNIVIELKDTESDWCRVTRISDDLLYQVGARSGFGGYTGGNYAISGFARSDYDRISGYDGGTQNGRYVDIYEKSLLPKELFEFEEKI